MGKQGIILEKKLRESDLKLPRTQSESQVASGAVVEAQHLALSKLKDTRSCCQQLEGMKEQLHLPCVKVTSVEAARSKAAARFMGILTRFQKEMRLKSTTNGFSQKSGNGFA